MSPKSGLSIRGVIPSSNLNRLSVFLPAKRLLNFRRNRYQISITTR